MLGYLGVPAREALGVLGTWPDGRASVSSLTAEGVRELYREGLVRLEIPISPSDKVR